MKKIQRTAICLFLLFVFLSPVFVSAQGTRADYDRAKGLRDKWKGLAVNQPDRPEWVEKTHKFWYRKSIAGGNEFVLVDADAATKAPAFDHEKLAAVLAEALKDKVDPKNLPFFRIEFVDEMKAIAFDAKESRWKYDIAAGTVVKIGPPQPSPWGDEGNWQDSGGPAESAASAEMKASPDGKWEAFIRNYNLCVRPKEAEKPEGPAGAMPGPPPGGPGGPAGPKKDEITLSTDGIEGNYYSYRSIVWSPDSKKIAAYRIRRGFHRKMQLVESSPADQLQPKYSSLGYTKPGDVLDVSQPVLFLVEGRRAVEIDNALFPNPFEISDPGWCKDSRAFAFEYNQRGHQVYRIIAVDAATGKPRAVISEEPKTFFCYSGKKYFVPVADGKEIVWMSERDGWNHLYLYDGDTGAVKNQITKGEWVVRGVDKVDEETRKIWFQASGMNPGQDPYFVHHYVINFDGTGLTALTEGDMTHAAAFSSDMAFYTDLYSRHDQPPALDVRRSSDRSIVMQAERTDIAGLVKAGWKAPEVFTAKGRDGKTDIWGVIYRPLNFNPKKKYPVIENIYAGPHDSFVPKGFVGYSYMQAMAELGFIVAQVDGMGTSNRSKAFHDVCWKNIGDAGFPDRILWHKAIAAKYPSYDISRVGIYGTSAGGQNALGALLFHPEFYKAGFSACGCHDNRMDKIWWNEQWMGWPIGPEYAASSNVENAWRLEGKLLLLVGEMDTNVDPSSTMQVVNALIKANKTFELIVIPGSDHTSGGPFGERKRSDFFVRNLLGVEPPDWNKPEPPPAKK
jgi:dipeptidyl aminopeptidase/acylaminoacyl peptidase